MRIKSVAKHIRELFVMNRHDRKVVGYDLRPHGRDMTPSSQTTLLHRPYTCRYYISLHSFSPSSLDGTREKDQTCERDLLG